MYNGYYFRVPRLAVEGRFDCTYLYKFEKDQPHKVFPRKRLEQNNVYQMKGLHRLISLTMLQPGMVYSSGSQPFDTSVPPNQNCTPFRSYVFPQIRVVPPLCTPKKEILPI